VVERAPGRVGRHRSTCPDPPGPLPKTVEKLRFGRLLTGFSLEARTITVGVFSDVPDGVVREPDRPGRASGILPGLICPHRRLVQNLNSGHGAEGIQTALHEGGLQGLRPFGWIVPGEPCTDFC